MINTGLLAITKLGSGLTKLDWIIIGVFLAVSTLVAVISKGRQAGVHDFFLGGRTIPWVAVCLSLMATEISAASFVGVPFSAFSGSLVYLQLAIGAIIARIIISYYFVPAFYETETYSPYHYVGKKLGLSAERITRILFMIGAVFGQAVRVFIVAIVLKIITGLPIGVSITIITVFAAIWAAIGGIRSVVWTDVLQFLAVLAAAIAAGVYLLGNTVGGFSQIISKATEFGKLQVFDFRLDQVLELTIWTGIFGSTFNTLASHGTDQMNTQRILCCRTASDARKAVLWSSLSQVFVLLLLSLGLALFCYYRQNVDSLQDYTLEVSASNIFPIFIATALPSGLKGLLVVGLLAAAISSMNSALAALSQTTARSLYTGTGSREGEIGRPQVRIARTYTFAWGILLGLVAWYFTLVILTDIVINAALKATSFTYGAMLGALLLAFLPHNRDGRGLVFSIPFAVLTAVGMSQHQTWAHWIVLVGIGLIFAGWCYMLFHEAEQLATIPNHDQYVRRAWYILLAEFPRTIWIFAGSCVVLYLHFGDLLAPPGESVIHTIAWPWYLPTGTGITVLMGYLLSRPKEMATDKAYQNN